MVNKNIGLVYGGASIGVMGEIADAVLKEGGEVIGVIPKELLVREAAHTGITELREVNTMHERKAMMAELSDGFIALPGGLGTIEEFFEIWTWAQLGIHRKPCGLLNAGRYYDKLIDFIDHAVSERFIKEIYRSMVFVEEQPHILLQKFESYEAPEVARWIDQKGI
jgi:uncharacterized protein (TIGR00730 family)